MSLSSIFATQVLSAVHAAGCTEDDDYDDNLFVNSTTSSSCSSNSVDLSSVDSYEDSNGPYRFTKYTLLLSTYFSFKQPSLFSYFS